MKIYEIIKEDEQQVNEFGGVLRALGTMGKALLPTAGKATSAGLKAPSKLQRLAHNVGKVGKAGKQVAGRTGQFTLGAINLTDEAIKWYARYQGIWKPIKEYHDTMAEWEAKLKAGEITDKQYEYVREKEMSYMIGRISSYILVSGIIRTSILPAVAGLKLWGATKMAGNTLASIAGSTLSTAGRAGQAYIVTEYINSPEGRELLAQAFAEGPLGDMIAPALGGSAAKLVDKVKGKARPQDDEEETPADKQAQANKFDKQTLPAGNDTTNMTKSGDYSNLARDPKTGELKIRTDY